MEATKMSINRRMNKGYMVHIYNGVLLSHKKYWNNVICSNMDGPTDSLSEIVRKRQIYDTAYTESKKKNDINEKVKVAQSCLILCDPLDYSLSGSCAHRILQARILEWVAVPFSRRCSQPRYQTQVSHIAGGFFTIWATSEDQLIYKADSQIQKTNLWLSGEKEGRGINWETGIDIYTLLCIK